MRLIEKESYECNSKGVSGKTLVVITLAILLFGCLLFFLLATPKLADRGMKISFAYEGQPQLGSKLAPVKIMEFADFKCPACKKFHHKILPQIKREFIDTGKAQMYFTNFQWMGPSSIIAGVIGESIYHQNNDSFWKYYDAIYTNQKKEDEDWLNPEFLFNLIEKNIPEVNLNKILGDLDKNRYEKEVLAENALARKLNIVEVPALFVNGKKIKNPLDYNEIKNRIKDELH